VHPDSAKVSCSAPRVVARLGLRASASKLKNTPGRVCLALSTGLRELSAPASRSSKRDIECGKSKPT
jgi:hypothetical protein